MKKLATTIIMLILTCGSLVAQPPTGNALQFNGSNTYVNCQNPTSLQITGNKLTLEAWIYMIQWRAAVYEGCIINKEHGSPDNGYMLRCGSTGRLNFNIGNKGWHEISSTTHMIVRTWYHVAGTYDGAVQKIYINGNLTDSALVSLTIGDASAINVWIGSCQSYPNRVVNGIIDEVRIWNVARSQSQIQAMMSDTLGPQYYTTADSGLVGYWRFDEGSGQTAFDMTSNHNDGILGASLDNTTGDPLWVSSIVAIRSHDPVVPVELQLEENYPNPFNPSTTITYSIPQLGFVTLKVYDIMGREVRTIVDEFQQSSEYSARFDAGGLSSGIYYYRLQVGGNLVETRKMILVR